MDFGALIRQLQGALGGRKIVSGVVDGPTGTIISGQGFSAARTGTGQYTVTFDSAFSEIPAVTLSPAELSVSAYAHPYDLSALATAAGFTMHFKDPGTTFLDGDWSFTAIGR